MYGKGVEHSHGLDVEGQEVGDVPFIERKGEISHHDITVNGIGGCCHARAVAPDVFLFFFGGAIGLYLVGALFDTETTIGIVWGLLVFLEAFEDVGTEVILFDIGIDVLDIVGNDFAQARDLLL